MTTETPELPTEDQAALPPLDDGPAKITINDLEGARMSLMEHLAELRVRLRNAGLIFIVALGVSAFFAAKLFRILAYPVMQAQAEVGLPTELQYLGPSDAFWVYFRLSMVVGLLAASPFIFWELWKFIAPGLYLKEKRMALTVTLATAFCFVGGSVFGYTLLAKPTYKFLLTVAADDSPAKPPLPIPQPVATATPNDGDKTKVPKAPSSDFLSIPMSIKVQLTMDSVADFQLLMLGGCGVAFELPVLLSILGAIGLITARSMWKFNKYALVLAAVVGGILTPGTDMVSQLMLAGPLYGLYNISIIIVWVIEKRRKKRLDALDVDAESGGEPQT